MLKIYKKMSFEELVEHLTDKTNITTREELLDYVKYCIDGDFLPTAIHILEELNNSSADYFDTDYSTGCSCIIPIESKQDIYQLYGESRFLNHVIKEAI